VDDVEDLVAGEFPQLARGIVGGELGRGLFQQLADRAAQLLQRASASVIARVRLEYWMSFCRVSTSPRSRGIGPRALQRST
jgi:hypothetical protein